MTAKLGGGQYASLPNGRYETGHSFESAKVNAPRVISRHPFGRPWFRPVHSQGRCFYGLLIRESGFFQLLGGRTNLRSEVRIGPVHLIAEIGKGPEGLHRIRIEGRGDPVFIVVRRRPCRQPRISFRKLRRDVVERHIKRSTRTCQAHPVYQSDVCGHVVS